MEKITDLMKERYGIKQTGKSLNVTPSDTLYTILERLRIISIVMANGLKKMRKLQLKEC